MSLSSIDVNDLGSGLRPRAALVQSKSITVRMCGSSDFFYGAYYMLGVVPNSSLGLASFVLWFLYFIDCYYSISSSLFHTHSLGESTFGTCPKFQLYCCFSVQSALCEVIRDFPNARLSNPLLKTGSHYVL